MSDTTTTSPVKSHVYQAIVAVMGEIAKTGIAKDRKNTQQGYSFRGIDDCYNALAPLMASHQLCILPSVVSFSTQDRQSQKGGTLIYTTVQMEFAFVSAVDGSQHVVRTIGEAMDSGDKSGNKAMSAALKYALLQTFLIPTEGDNDTENASPVLAPAPVPDKRTPPKVKAKESPNAPASAAPAEHPKVTELRKFFTDAGCKTSEDMLLVARMGCHDADLARAKREPEHAKAILDGLHMAIVDYKTPAAILEAARNVPV